MQIRAQPIDVIQNKLQKIRCCTGCLNNINYLVFGHGLYCGSCLSTLPEITPDHFINLQSLAQLLVDATNQYAQRSKGEVNQLNLIKGEMETLKKDVKKSKEALSYDARTVKEKSLATIDQLYAECVKQNQNEPLEAFYEPDITATLIMNESHLLLQNLNNLTVSLENGKIEYKLIEQNKNPQKVNKRVKKQYKELEECIQSATIQCKGIISNFLKDVSDN